MRSNGFHVNTWMGIFAIDIWRRQCSLNNLFSNEWKYSNIEEKGKNTDQLIKFPLKNSIQFFTTE